LILRLLYLQIAQGSWFVRLGKKNFLKVEVISPPRGNLLDCNGILLAANRPVFDLFWQGSGSNLFSDEQKNILKKLEEILKISFEQDSKLEYVLAAEKYSKRFLLKSDINFDELCRISEQCSDCSNLVIENRFKRVYPYLSFASHILGYLSKQEAAYKTVGIYGIEKHFQQDLKGETGYYLNIINSKGRKLNQKDFQGAKAGADLVLTLDFNMQSIAESLFEPEQAGAFVIMDPENGAIKVFMSYPNFDPNVFLEPISTQDWENKFSYNNPLLNRITNATYPPASIFKLMTFTAGLEEGIITKDTQFFCGGSIKFCDRKYHCIRRTGHGPLDSKMALAYSCNIPCFNIAQKLKVDQLAEYAYKFGFGGRTGFLLPEKSGLVPNSMWKAVTMGQHWWTGDTLSVSIGQGYLLVTPLQIVRMIAAICTGYLVKPRIVEQEDIQAEKLDVSESVLKFLRLAMREVVLSGSASNLSTIPDFEVCAKTGTAQTSSLQKERLSKRQLEHAWLASYFSYKGQKPLVMVVLVENAGSSTPARKIAAKFLTVYGNYLKKLEEKI
jgi:penicillin-binding protein 2